jgi:PIN domain nuclease of toxin-antitoxin system
MIALLDTHAFIWIDSDPARVSQTVQGYLSDPGCTVFLSVASIWEMMIKVGTGKLVLRAPVPDIVAENLRQTPLQLLPVSPDHAYALGPLPSIHRDPFDRMLVAQAVAENAVLLTDDPIIRQYPVRTDW